MVDDEFASTEELNGDPNPNAVLVETVQALQGIGDGKTLHLVGELYRRYEGQDDHYGGKPVRLNAFIDALHTVGCYQQRSVPEDFPSDVGWIVPSKLWDGRGWVTVQCQPDVQAETPSGHVA